MRAQKSECGAGVLDTSGWVHSEGPRQLAPAGHYIAIRISFAFPVVEQNCLPEAWVREYTASGLLVHDPAMAWAYQNQGFVRTRDLVAEDGQGVLELAKYHGLNFGAVVCCIDEDLGSERSFGFFFRSDREYTTLELEQLHAGVLAAHRAYARPKNLTEAELETLGPGEERPVDEGDRLGARRFRECREAAAAQCPSEAQRKDGFPGGGAGDHVGHDLRLRLAH